MFSGKVLLRRLAGLEKVPGLVGLCKCFCYRIVDRQEFGEPGYLNDRATLHGFEAKLAVEPHHDMTAVGPGQLFQIQVS